MKELETNTQIQELVVAQTSNDFKHALLVVSVLLNVAVLTAWLVIQADARYALILTLNS